MGAYRDTHPDIGEHLNALHSALEEKRAASSEALTKHKMGLTEEQQNKLRGMLNGLRVALNDGKSPEAEAVTPGPAVTRLQTSRALS